MRGPDLERAFLEQIEEAALNAWPSTRQILYDGWVLRFTGGESKRVNSVNVRHDSSLPLPEKITFCESVYGDQSLPTLFRCPEPFTPENLINALLEAGYVSFDTTLVLGREIEEPIGLPSGIEMREMEPDDWIQMRAELYGKPVKEFEFHAGILQVIVPEKVLVGLFVGDQPVACGMGVVQGPLLGYFSILTGRSARRNRYGTAVMDALTGWGAARGAKFGYLQVEGDNRAAQAMYEKLGFSLLYPYSYFRRESKG